jgi:hypothetical protein
MVYVIGNQERDRLNNVMPCQWLCFPWKKGGVLKANGISK